MESIAIGKPGQVPTDDIDTRAQTLFKMFGNHSGQVIPNGLRKTITFSKSLRDFGDFRDANVMLINAKSADKPFTIGLP